MSVSLSEKYTVMADAPWLANSTEATAELLHRSLAHRVRDGTRPINVGEHRSHQHDLPAAADHRFQRGRHCVDHTGHVDGHDSTHLVGRECAEGTATPENARVRDHDIDASELLACSPHHLLDRIELGDIAFQRQTAIAW